MDPVTLYVLVLTPTGIEKLSHLHRPTMADCETLRARILESAPVTNTVLNSVCWPQGKWPPDWVRQRPIHGVPLDPALQPRD